MDKLTSAQRGCIYAMVNKLGLDKAALISGLTDGRTEHTSELSKDEAKELIQYLKSQDSEEVKCEKIRRAIISMAHEMGYRFPGTKKVDMKKLDSWCVKYGKFKKKLNQHNLKELGELRWQFGQRRDSFMNDY